MCMHGWSECLALCLCITRSHHTDPLLSVAHFLCVPAITFHTFSQAPPPFAACSAACPVACADTLVCVCECMCMQMESQLGSAEAVLRAVATAVFAAGSKSCSHVFVLVERYSHLLLQLMQAVGEQEQGQGVLLEVLGHMYSHMPTRLHIALSR